jgi:hypothetical protein
MQSIRNTFFFTFWGVLTSILVICEVHADDPLNAFPTALASAAVRLKELTEEQLKTIQLPEKKSDLVFSIATVPINVDDETDARRMEPWLKVFADGHIDCRNQILWKAKRCQDRIEHPELLWLLHLAVNESHIPSRSTADIEKDVERHRQTVKQRGRSNIYDLPVQEQYVYHLNLPTGQVDLQVPDVALVLRPLRRKLKLDAFASLNLYAHHLACRPYLGNLVDRNFLLVQLNEKLKDEEPTAPPFGIEHLASASNLDNADLSAVFRQVIDLQTKNNNVRKYKEVTGFVVRRGPGDEPEIRVTSRENWK